jgi:hypothetical protein
MDTHAGAGSAWARSAQAVIIVTRITKAKVASWVATTLAK